ncbi:MAG: hypothetical protein O3A91_02330 [Proteobacteria bacterium]|nr:hypothetical protein [Pseudomonadota bacterium]
MGKSVTGIRLAAAGLLLLAPLLSHAAGLGSLTVTSPLGQPLSAEIEIISLQQGEADSLSARLASPEALRQAGMEMSSSLIGLQLTIDRRAGKPYIRLRSTQPINDPFLDVLIELQWATGRLVRQYTFLLDPAEYKKPAPGAEPAPAPRIGDLGKNVTDLQKLMELKNQQLAELEKKSGDKPEAPKAAEPAKTAEAPKQAPEAAPAPDAKKARAPTKAPPPALEPDLLDEFTNFVSDPVSGGGLAGVLLLLVGYGAWAWKKKKSGQNSSQFQDSVLGAASGGAARSVFGAGAAPGATAATPAASISEAPSVREAPSVVAAEPDQLDPIADADVYMAYGRNAQAEEILKEALAKDSSRVPVHVKLLEIYASQRDAKAFEQAARKVKSLTGSSGPDWDKAMALGHSIDPSNGLYGTGAATSPGAEAAAPATAAPALEFRESKAASSSGLDFDLDKTYEGGLNLGAAPKADAAKPAADPDAIVSMDFDLNLDLGGDKPAEVKASPSSGDLDIGSLSLDIGGASGAAGAAGGDAKWQELATKLDLARELLNEVANDGDARQQAQAKQMLGNLG